MTRIVFKKILAIAATALVSIPLAAQRPANEISVMSSVFSVPQMGVSLAGVLGTAISFGLSKVSDISTSSALSVEYFRHIKPHFAVGASATWEQISLTIDTYDGKDEQGNTQYKSGDKHIRFYSVMPEVKAIWFNRPHVSMYSKAGVGICLSHINASGGSDSSASGGSDSNTSGNSANGLTVAFQLCAAGIDFGGERLRGFAEIGAGMQGTVLGGMRYSF